MTGFDKADFKFHVLKEYFFSRRLVDDICEKHDVPKTTLYRWARAYQKDGCRGLVPKSRRPKRIHETPICVQKIIIELKTELNLGANSISQILRPLHSISHTGILKVLRRLGLTHTQEKKPWKSFRANAKNEMWQSDMLGPFSTPIGEISMLVVLDDWSRYAMSRILHGRGKTKEATAFLDESIIKQGKLESILTNHGPQFRKTFDKWCKRKNRHIKHLNRNVLNTLE